MKKAFVFLSLEVGLIQRERVCVICENHLLLSQRNETLALPINMYSMSS